MSVEKDKTDQWLGFSDISVDYGRNERRMPMKEKVMKVWAFSEELPSNAKQA